ncbi:acyl-[acyl-carrier-protein]--UDP-N-acetylglucosamine O-acyltransferase [Paraphotobacterium marinum]|uniref:Acyl-[acyl-carrier-protein]--UDP-N-acetylglucosamine O-acyltransferase n=1 Tax=Paraphotobacterium marinum TaxID=1755811 RepID=A0A220VCW2_9GAMM|nr:acyl-ACP--UDP-N-acetylglucosamine O-acyltransferase [Paraphotobacterium marinum]ASK77813.1 acyl-[acyl-carrier-protein]--UDP-N-acetylglucosamine O-acyltransferase [Paraphotobacterium marinum]
MIHESANIHPSSIIEDGAIVGPNCKIGPFCVIGKNVRLDSGNILHSHIVINGHTKIGKNNEFFQFCSIGEVNQDKKYKNEATELIVGNGNTFHECCTVHRGTIQDNGKTIVGDNNWIMAYVHIGHDAVIGNNTVMANNVTLAGHINVGDHAYIGGCSAIHQFCRIGAYAAIAGGALIEKDVPPFIFAQGDRKNQVRGVHEVSAKRSGNFTEEDLHAIKGVYKLIYKSDKLLKDIIPEIEEKAKDNAVLTPFVTFFQESKRGLVR